MWAYARCFFLNFCIIEQEKSKQERRGDRMGIEKIVSGMKKALIGGAAAAVLVVPFAARGDISGGGHDFSGEPWSHGQICSP